MSYKELIWKLAKGIEMSKKEENEVKRIVQEIEDVNYLLPKKRKKKLVGGK